MVKKNRRKQAAATDVSCHPKSDEWESTACKVVESGQIGSIKTYKCEATEGDDDNCVKCTAGRIPYKCGTCAVGGRPKGAVSDPGATVGIYGISYAVPDEEQDNESTAGGLINKLQEGLRTALTTGGTTYDASALGLGTIKNVVNPAPGNDAPGANCSTASAGMHIAASTSSCLNSATKPDNTGAGSLYNGEAGATQYNFIGDSYQSMDFLNMGDTPAGSDNNCSLRSLQNNPNNTLVSQGSESYLQNDAGAVTNICFTSTMAPDSDAGKYSPPSPIQGESGWWTLPSAGVAGQMPAICPSGSADTCDAYVKLAYLPSYQTDDDQWHLIPKDYTGDTTKICNATNWGDCLKTWCTTVPSL